MKRHNRLGVIAVLLLLGVVGFLVHRERPCADGVCPVPTVPQDQENSRGEATRPAPVPSPPRWEAVAPGLEYRRQSVAGGQVELALLRADLRRVELEVADVRRPGRAAASARELGREGQALAAVNGGFFDEQGKPLGLLLHAGRQTNPLRRVDWGVFSVIQSQARIAHARDGVPRGASEALQCGPRLVIRGRIPAFKPGLARRSGIGITAEGRVIIAVSSQGQLTLRDFARALKAFGCRDALNLDGGGSTQLYLHTSRVTCDVPGAWPVPSALVVLPRDR
jgi:uncharacterized protein YigE (DUF2233 family)